MLRAALSQKSVPYPSAKRYKEMLNSNAGLLGGRSEGQFNLPHHGLYDTYNNSLHFQLSIHLAALGTVTSLVAQHMYAMPPYAFMAKDFTT